MTKLQSDPEPLDLNLTTPDPSSPAEPHTAATVPAGRLAPWTVGDLPPAPGLGPRTWLALVGPGLLMAGVSIGAGEWLFGPAVTGQYGAVLLWLASISIIGQVFFNMEVMRYALYCGEPIFVGYLRTWPGPRAWTVWYMLIDISNIWPFMASAAAIPLAAAYLQHLPVSEAPVVIAGYETTEHMLVKILGYVVFVLAFVPLIFGGTIYRMIERLMTTKIVLVLGYLLLLTVFMVSARNMREVVTGFFQFGTIPLRAETVVAGPHFTVTEHEGSNVYTIKGTIENGQALVIDFDVPEGEVTDDVLEQHEAARQRLVGRAQDLAQEGRFFVEDTKEDVTLRIGGIITPERIWQPDKIEIEEADGPKRYSRLEEVPGIPGEKARALVKYQGAQRVSLFGYVRQHGRLPDLNWAILAAFAAIAGAGGMSNTLSSNYARDKGWGMGKLVGAIPSAVGGHTITLSHVGKVFPLDKSNMARWRGWIRHIFRDQAIVWMLCCFVGMALPCMVSLEFIRNVPVEGDRVTALIADGASRQYPEYRNLLWPLTLLCSVLILAPGQIFAGESISRRWADAIWVSSTRAHRLKGNQVQYIYYAILAAYGAWGLVALSLFDPLMLATVGAVLGNVALGFTSFHTLYVNRTLLPKALRPNWFMQLGLLGCGVFFMVIWVIGLIYLGA